MAALWLVAPKASAHSTSLISSACYSSHDHCGTGKVSVKIHTSVRALKMCMCLQNITYFVNIYLYIFKYINCFPMNDVISFQEAFPLLARCTSIIRIMTLMNDTNQIRVSYSNK